MFYVYVLKSQKTGSLYMGFTRDLRKRVKEHNQKRTQATQSHTPLILIYYEACLNEKDAKRREHYLKTTQGGRLLKRRLKEYFYKLNH